MVAEAITLPEDYGELKEFTTQLLAEIKAQAMLIEKLRHQVAGQKAWRYGSTSEQTKQLVLALEASELPETAMTVIRGKRAISGGRRLLRHVIC